MFILYLYIAVLVFAFCYLLFSYFVKVEVGNPPLGELVFVYRYQYCRQKMNYSAIKNLRIDVSDCKRIRLYYYGRKTDHLEYAHGVILNEMGNSVHASMLSEITKTEDLNLFCTPAISHAIFIVIPILKWCPLTKFLAVIYGYPKLSHFVEKYNLCAYPVVEIYSKSSVSLIIPLIRQDEFVVTEAEQHVFGLTYTPSLRHIGRIKLTADTHILHAKALVKREIKG